MEAVETLLTMESCPVNVPALSGSNWTCSAIDCTGFRVTGNFAAEMENPVPVTAAEFNVSGAVPVEEIVTACACGELRTTLPNPIDFALTLIFAAVADEGER